MSADAPSPELWRSALSGRDGKVRLALRVQPGAKRSVIVGMYGERLKIAVQAPPVDGKANAAVIALMAKLLGLPRRRLEIGAGQSSRDKRLDIDGTLAEVGEALSRGLDAQGRGRKR